MQRRSVDWGNDHSTPLLPLKIHDTSNDSTELQTHPEKEKRLTGQNT